jgi:adenylylsulfate kinase-like enzyme
MNNVTYLIGLPGAGKTLYGRLYTYHTPGSVLVSGDMIREIMYGKYKFDKEIESYVFAAFMSIVCGSLKAKNDVIVDDAILTINSTERKYLRNLLDEKFPELHHYAIQFNTPLEKCIEMRTNDNRDLPESQWVKTITELNAKYEPVQEQENFDGVTYQ